MSENHGKKQYKQQQNENPAQSPELIHDTAQNSSENSDYSSYTDSSDQPEPGTRAYLYYHRGEPYRTAQKAAKKAAKKRDQSLLDDPKFQRNMAYLTKKQEEMKAAGWTSALPSETEEIDRTDEIPRDDDESEIPHIGQKRYAQKGPAGSFSYPEVPSPPPVADDEDEDDDAEYLGTLPPNANWGLPHNEFGQPLDTEYEAVEILAKKTRRDGKIWYLVKFKEAMFDRDTHWCREDDCENCPELIKEFDQKQKQKLQQNMSEISAMSSDPSSASLSDSSEDSDFTPPPTNSSSSSSSSSETEDLEPCD